ncbi:MAG: hypothetical protein GY701_02530 [Sulfitobacter sp.]|nr:hypothetical protein [Sulfitobacter sp.]
MVGADRYRNPDEDLPVDFDQRREDYYGKLNLPSNAAHSQCSSTMQVQAIISMGDEGLLTTQRTLRGRGSCDD